jgi:hypothetical protein
MRCNNKESELQSAQAGFLFPILWCNWGESDLAKFGHMY